MQNVMSFVTHDGRLVAGLDIDPGNFNNPVVIDEINNYCLEHPELSEMNIRPFFVGDVIKQYSPDFISEDSFYDRLMFENNFYANYDRIKYPEKLSLEVRSDSIYDDSRSFTWKYENVPLTKCMEINQKIKMLTSDIKSSALSPFEKAAALYMLTTHFIDSYKESVHDEMASTMHILSDDEDGYKVTCAGYTDLFCRMAAECGITAKTMQIFAKDNNCDKDFAHEVAVVDIDDSKYGIYGSFICDIRMGSDMRENVDAGLRETVEELGEDCKSFYTTNSFAWFCLPISDYDTFTRKFLWQPFSDVKYAIDTNTVTDRIGEYVSNERIGIGKIGMVLENVHDFIFVENGKERDFDDDIDATLMGVIRLRRKIDAAFEKSENIKK